MEQIAEIDPGLAHFRAAHPGKRQQIVNQHSHLPAGIRNGLHIVPALVRKLATGLAREHVHVALHMPQRRAQIVRCRIAERVQFLIERFELGRAVAHALLQVRVQAAQFLRHPVALGDVALGGRDANRLTGLIQQFRDREPHIVHAPVLAYPLGLKRDNRFPGGQPARELLLLCQFSGGCEMPNVHQQRLGLTVAIQQFRTPVPCSDPAREILNCDRIVGVAHHSRHPAILIACRHSFPIKPDPLLPPDQTDSRQRPQKQGPNQQANLPPLGLERRVHFRKVDAGHQCPGRIRNAAQGRQHRLVPVINSFHAAHSPQRGLHRRQRHTIQRGAEVEGGIPLEPELIQKDGFVAFLADEQRLGGPARHRPALDEWIEIAGRVNRQDQHTQRPVRI